jgi:hypothetical protein
MSLLFKDQAEVGAALFGYGGARNERIKLRKGVKNPNAATA